MKTKIKSTFKQLTRKKLQGIIAGNELVEDPTYGNGGGTNNGAGSGNVILLCPDPRSLDCSSS
ncbi:hypothetical protein CEY12_20085 [Chryseobacterium sp. T16E-39]|uniref:hypothetical protein n=1 Tax=Chryseobacterium sp. T16E-39 TaxID=2015076 RepID=UPI000B5B2D4F|nr:hypothetical protein [Chryseobacterium sp. T16E-39]ASK32244.1 hypothetical protein CEY12_20085 [Chryseobacterium sp. T16E-39]